MKLKAYNVKHGDFFILEGNKDRLVVDCGDKYPYDMVKNYLCDGIFDERSKDKSVKLYAMITHFDQDHISGFNNLTKTTNGSPLFDKLFIPYILTDGRKNYVVFWKFIFYARILIYSESAETTKITTALMNQINLCEQLTECITDIQPVGKGKIISFDGSNFKVLSPDYTSFDLNKINSTMEKFIDEIEEVINLKYDDSQEIEREAVRYNDVLNKFSNSIGDSSELQNQSIKELAETEKEISKKIEALREKYIEKIKTIKGKDIALLKMKVGKLVSKTKNSTSIVFKSEKIEADDKIKCKLLMTGDAKGKNVAKLVNDEKIDIIELCKIPHHGTEAYFMGVNQNFIVEKAVIPAGGNKRCLIYKEYPLSTSLYKNIYCTNGSETHYTCDNYCELQKKRFLSGINCQECSTINTTNIYFYEFDL